MIGLHSCVRKKPTVCTDSRLDPPIILLSVRDVVKIQKHWRVQTFLKRIFTACASFPTSTGLGPPAVPIFQ